ncbi:methyl-accepting chemotaxis protein [Xylophilus sp. GOD-11R]|uniref:methyl-accepting chemotaxis protein n=1 Tax=Xylophilus sp. GOD-11R TaxID=3089814 RepID=UPI00298BDE8C|nr:methyl-accepting chemotaxis protein [Xylophilus sp. GOD-11R]WPB55655.1 methyl-accepting chemotaxis protein [Xylophilus sp. GOD-11R]
MNAFRNLKIGSRLAIAFAVILVILVLSAVAGVWRLNSLASRMHALATVDNEKQQIAAQWLNTVTLNGVRTRAALLGSPDIVPELQRDMDATSAVTVTLRDRLVKIVETPGGKAMIAAIDSAREAYRTPRGELMKRRAAGEDVRAVLDSQLKPLSDAYIGAIQQFQVRQEKRYANALAAAEADAEQGQHFLIGCGVVAVLLGAFLAVTLTRSIVGPLRRASESTRRIAEGDLTETIVVSGKDEASEVLHALQAMQSNLGRVVAGVRTNAEGVATASAEIAQGNNDLSGRTEQQASALEETAASMEQLSSTVKQNSDNAQQANKLAQGATNVAVEGGEVVARVVDTMKGINESSRKIADIISVIDGIAFQTNILALNAAVEAARAGEQGRGFAVVASEVRSLAQRSADAAKQIKGLIGTSVERVEQGTSLVDQAGSTMQEVVSAIRRVTDLMGEISAASVEQSSGVAQVGEAVMQMDQATQQNAALVEQSAAAAASLKGQAEQLVEAVAVFRLAGGGGAVGRAYTAPAAVKHAAIAAPAPAPRAGAPASVAFKRPVAGGGSEARAGHSPSSSGGGAAPQLGGGAPRKAAASAPAAAAQSDDDWETF